MLYDLTFFLPLYETFECLNLCALTFSFSLIPMDFNYFLFKNDFHQRNFIYLITHWKCFIIFVFLTLDWVLRKSWAQVMYKKSFILCETSLSFGGMRPVRSPESACLSSTYFVSSFNIFVFSAQTHRVVHTYTVN